MKLALAAMGAILGLGAGSALSLYVGPLRTFAETSPRFNFITYGFATAVLAVGAIVAGLILRRRGLPSSWPSLEDDPRFLPAAALLAGLGSGFYAGAYNFIGKVQWSVSQPDQLWFSLVPLVFLARFIYLPVATIVVSTTTSTRKVHLLAVALLAGGFELGWPLATWIEERIWNLETETTSHFQVLACVGLALVLPRLWTPSPR